jgi:hypothetical protein
VFFYTDAYDEYKVITDKNGNTAGYLFFFADFEKNSVRCRLKGIDISGRQFYEAVEKNILN